MINSVQQPSGFSRNVDASRTCSSRPILIIASLAKFKLMVDEDVLLDCLILRSSDCPDWFANVPFDVEFTSCCTWIHVE